MSSSIRRIVIGEVCQFTELGFEDLESESWDLTTTHNILQIYL